MEDSGKMTPPLNPESILSAIDIGSNSVHLLVAQMTEAQGLKIIDSHKIILRLGAAFDHSKNLRQEAITRTVLAIKQLRDLALAYGPKIRCVATHAVREAKNHHDLIEQVEISTGISIEIIDGVEEARLAALGMNYGFGLGQNRFFGVDIGGGSTELIISKQDRVDFVASIKLGAVALSEKFHATTGPSDAEIADLKEYIWTRLAPLEPEFRHIRIHRAFIGAGTAKAIAAIDAAQNALRPSDDLNGYRLSAAAITAIDEKIQSLRTPRRIRQELSIESDRAEILLAGSAILRAITEIFSISEWTYSTYAMREGLIIDTYRRMSTAGTELEENVRWQSIKRLGRRFQIDAGHAERVTRLALQIYDSLSNLCAAKPPLTQQLSDRDLLKYASWLHECGKFVCYSRYNRHSFYLIFHSRMLGFTQEEREYIGHIARFHRKGLADTSRKECQGLPSSKISRINYLAGILRIATTLCRTRRNIIDRVEVGVENDRFKFKVFHLPTIAPDAEIHELDRDKRAIEKSLAQPVEFEVKIIGEKS